MTFAEKLRGGCKTVVCDGAVDNFTRSLGRIARMKNVSILPYKKAAMSLRNGAALPLY